MKFKSLILIGILGTRSLMSFGQADCGTAAGVLALTFAKVVVGDPRDPQDVAAATALPWNITSELFKVAQNEATNTSCFTSVTFKLYTATTSAALSNLPSLAAANADFTVPAGVVASTMTKSRAGNVITAAGSRTRTTYAAGAVVFYRIAKRIKNCSSCTGPDPYVFSTTYSCTIPPAPAPVVVAKKADLIPQPTTNSHRNRPLFKPTSGTYGEGTESFLRIPDVFCATTLTQGTLVKSYSCGLSTSNPCREFRQGIALTPIIYAAKNTGDTAAGAFSVSLFRKDQTLGTAGSLTAVGTNQVTTLAVNTESTIFSFNPNKTVDVYAFPEANPGMCFVRCDPNTAGCMPPYQELEFIVKVDGGNSATNGTVSEKSEKNNEGNPMDN